MQNSTQISCPNCGTSIDVNDILSHQLEEQIQKKYQAQLADSQKEIKTKEMQLATEKAQFEEKKQRENELFQERVDSKLKEERKVIEEKLIIKLQADQADQFKSLQDELNQKSEQVKELNASKAEIERLKREKDEVKSQVEAEAQKQLTVAIQSERDKIKKSE